MQHVRFLNACQLDASFVTIGSFDGVHLGHKTIIKKMVMEAHQRNVPTVVITFYPHPSVVLRHIKEPFYLTSPEERATLLGELGIDYVITLNFDEKLAALTAFEFMQSLSNQLKLKRLLVGRDFALGKGRLGNVDLLKEIGTQMGYILEVIPEVTDNGDTISSSQVRGLLSKGDVRHAARLLGRDFSFTGKVIHGEGRGKHLGFPTANLSVWSEQMFPAWGIYASWVFLGLIKFPSATNVGIRPTFKTNIPSVLIEAHILDFEDDIYGQEIKLAFVEYLRPELRFDTEEALIKQMEQDIQKTREVLAIV